MAKEKKVNRYMVYARSLLNGTEHQGVVEATGRKKAAQNFINTLPLPEYANGVSEFDVQLLRLTKKGEVFARTEASNG